jgi:hypothetical protein
MTKIITSIIITSILIVGAFALPNASALTVIEEYDDKTEFLTATGAISVGAFPDDGSIGAHPASKTVGDATFSTVHSPQALFVGANGIGAVPGGDWTSLTTGNDIALSDDEDLDIVLASDVYSIGFEFVEPSCTIQDAGNLCPNSDIGSNVDTVDTIDSEFEVTLKDDGTTIAQFTFNAPDDQAAFVGVWSNDPFDSVEIRETTGGNDNEYYGEFYTGDTPIQAVCSEENDLEICKAVIIVEETADGVIAVGEHIIYHFFIGVQNDSGDTLYDVEVQDRFGGDLAVGDVGEDLTDPDHNQADVIDDEQNLMCELSQKGKTNKEFLDCVADEGGDQNLEDGGSASVAVTAETDYNPGQGKKDTPKREYTSCGIHEPNSGATVLFHLFDDPIEYSLSTDPITVEVFEYADLSGDCDKDGIPDGEDPEPFFQDSDLDGIENPSDNCPYTANHGQEDADNDNIGNACDEETVLTLGPGWDNFVTPLTNGDVTVGLPTGGNWDIEFNLQGAPASTTFIHHGIDVFGVTCPAPAFFGDVPLLACGTFTRTGESGPNMETVAVYSLGTLDTDVSGDVSSPYTISGIASGSYDIEFWVGSSVVYQSDGNGNGSFGFGDTIEIVVP